MKKRLFVAIPLPKYFKEKFIDFGARQNLEGIRWTTPENLHITVYFLGYVDEGAVPRLIEALQGVFLQTPQFDLEFKKISLAPPNRSPYMIWAIFNDAGGVYKALVDRVYDALREFITRDNRSKEFIPHITLARFKRPSSGREVKIIQPNAENMIMKVSSCDLMESHLSRTGPTYSVIKEFSLKGT